ncbi:acyl-CoA dehydrogenase family protein [Rhodococcus opacus]|uniref:acyl-CoA dehydrogenase family protein n=1 Tax=Rhodococcus opacus TaxID=37919 RepID=UPI0018E43A2C|nr:acyl-CoA dehydrogenase family protein [Rhodococcus opacus]
MTQPGNTELADLRSSIRGLLERRLPPGNVRKVTDGDEPYDRGLWRSLNDDFGLAAMAVPEDLGGLDAGPAAMAVIGEELGRALAPVPFLSSVVLAAKALSLAADTHAADTWLPRLLDGAIGTAALTDRAGRPVAQGSGVQVTGDGGDTRLHGVRGFVPDVAVATVLIVAAQSPSGTVLYAIEPDRDGVSVAPVRMHDRTRRLADVAFDGTPCTPDDIVAAGSTADALLDHLYCAAHVALAADASGGARRILDLSVQYAKERVQFDRVIGSFQAVKHKLADAYVQVEGATAAASGSAIALARNDLDKARLSAAFARDAYVRVAGDAVQVHGGIGYTWEHVCHLHFKRAQLDHDLFGSADWHRSAAVEGLLPTG